jgi:hypothetical protein
MQLKSTDNTTIASWRNLLIYLIPTLYEQENPEDINLFEMDKKQLLDLGLKTHNSTIKLAS